jgi:hypothetical protein
MSVHACVRANDERVCVYLCVCVYGEWSEAGLSVGCQRPVINTAVHIKGGAVIKELAAG